MKSLLTALLAICFIVAGYAQTLPSSTPILLKNFKITSSEMEWTVQGGEEIDGRYYRIVNDISELKLNREYEGFRVVEYLPKRAFVVSIDRDASTKVKSYLKDAGATSVLRIHPEWKLSDNMLDRNIPDWTWVNNTQFRGALTYFKDLDGALIVDVLQNLGYDVLRHFKAEQVIELTLTPDEIGDLASLPFVSYFEEVAKPGEPENNTARTNHRVNYLQSSFPGSVHFDGTGVTVGHGDDDLLGEHVDFKGRVSGLLGSNSGDHGDHVAGTIFGAGNKDPRARGMAPGAEILYSDYPDNLRFVDNDFINHGVRITSSSYSNGCGAGYTNTGTTGSRTMDLDVMQNPPVMHVFSAGNSGTSTCGYGVQGQSGGVSGWGNITGGHKVAKNVVTCANITLADGLAASSSRGPAADGRIKPDISAVGTLVYSTTDQPAPNSYTRKTGTSMSCPGVSGTMATLYQAYRSYNGGQDPESALIKGVALNTADDLGNPGPDFRFGYGRINARRAHDVLAGGNWMTDSISAGTNSHTITVPAGNYSEVRVMLIWADPPGFSGAARVLVNDLDLAVTQGGTTRNPWVLDPTASAMALNSTAVRERDSLNNMEQVTYTNVGTGTINVGVSAFNIPSGSQKYYINWVLVKDEIVVTFPVGGEGFSPTRNEYIRWDAPVNTGSYQLDYSTDAGATWTLISSSVFQTRRYFNWNVPNVTTDQAKIRVIQGTDTAFTPGTFVIANEPTNFSILSSCPDSATLSWDPVSNVTGYEVYALGPMYMDSIGYTTDTFFIVNPNNPNKSDDWYSVASVVNGKAGERIIAIQKPVNVINCLISDDLGISQVISPIPGPRSNCFSTTDSIEIELVNDGINDVFGFSVSYSLNGGAPITQAATDTITPGQYLNFLFNGAFLLNAGINDIEIWVNYGIDQNPYNDSAIFEVIELNDIPKSMPYFNDFENFNSCGTANDCGQTVCILNEGWSNVTSGPGDDIDFRVNSGNTQSSNTGPTTDYNPGTANGNYVYLESSNGCDSALAILHSPCLQIDSNALSPVVEFAYHMYGSNMGKLNVDLITAAGVVENVVPEVSGNQTNNWILTQIDLSPWIGEVVMVRFRGKTGNGWRSDLALDDFSYYDTAFATPTSSYSVSNNGNCAGDTFVFQSTSSGTIASYSWDFGLGASPATAISAGPHSVVYGTGGFKQTSLEVSSLGGLNKSTNGFNISRKPTPGFNYSLQVNVVNFNDGSSGNPFSWHWDFGDGDTSNVQNPTHTYVANNNYVATLTATNSCGSNDFSDTVSITTIGRPELMLDQVSLYPNPTSGVLSVQYPDDLKDLVIQVSDLSGKSLITAKATSQSSETKINMELLPSGIYMVELHSNLGSRSFKVIKE